jgi:hypothetical protein
MKYERAEGAVAVEALLRRIADGIAKGAVDVAGLTVASQPAVEASVSVEGDADGSLVSVVLRMTPLALVDRASALEGELSHPGG